MHTTLEQINKYRLSHMFQRQISDKDIACTKILIMGLEFSGRFENHIVMNGFCSLISGFMPISREVQILFQLLKKDIISLSKILDYYYS